jgi:hypothetical protein
MSFPLSNLDWLQFSQDEAATIQVMSPGDHKIVNWDNRSILIFIGANPITVDGNLYPDVYLTDVSDAPQLQAMLQPGYSAPPQGMLDTLPQAIEDTITSEAATAGALVNSAGQAVSAALVNVATTAGKVAAGAVSPLLGDLTPILIGAAVLLFILYMPKSSR